MFFVQSVLCRVLCEFLTINVNCELKMDVHMYQLSKKKSMYSIVTIKQTGWNGQTGWA